MASMDSTPPPETPDGRKIVDLSKLSEEEIQVFRQCQSNSMRRGFGLGIVSYLACKVAQQMGYLRKYPRTSVLGFTFGGFFAGIYSYRSTFKEKILALENSELAEIIREGYAKKGKALPSHLQRHSSSDDEFQNESHVPEQEEVMQPVISDPFDSPLNKRLQRYRHEDESSMENNRNWDQIQKEAKANSSKNRQGVTYDDLRLKSRANLGDYGSLTPEEEEELEKTLKKKPPSYDYSQPPLSDRGKTGGSRKNKYGDELQ